MSVVLGLLIIVAAILIGVMVLGMAIDNDALAFIGIGGFVLEFIVFLVGAGVFIMLNGDKPTAQANHCYKAVPHTSMSAVLVGKVIIPIEGTNLVYEEIPCP